MRERVLGLVVAASVALVAGCSTTSGPTSPPSAITIDPDAQVDATGIPWPDAGEGAPGELSLEVAQGLLMVRDYARATYPGNFAGTATGTAESVDRLVIYIVDGTPELESDLVNVSGIPDAEKVVFRVGRLAVSDSDALDAELTAQAPTLIAEGIDIQQFGPGVDGVEEIGVHHLTDDEADRLFDVLGPDLRVFESRRSKLADGESFG